MRRYKTTTIALRRIILAAGSLLAAGVFLLALQGLLGSTMGRSALAQPDAVIRYVAPSGSDSSNTCTNTSTPCKTVQHAVDEAQTGNEIRVATGVYTDIQARLGITQVVHINKTVTVRGGYTTDDWEASDPELNPTTLDAQGLGRVLVITGGDASGLAGHPGGQYPAGDAGGGLVIYTATATISNCVIVSNTAISDGGDGYGGGLFLYHSDVTLEGNTIANNIANQRGGTGVGGGLFLYHSDTTLLNNTLQDNVASPVSWGTGGGLYASSSDVTLQGNTVVGNTASKVEVGYGGGLFIGGTAILTGNTIISNTASTAYWGRGGGLYFHGDARLVGNAIIGNKASAKWWGNGGGAYLSGDITLIDNTIISNTAGTAYDGKGGGIYLTESDAFLRGNTVQGNIASTGVFHWGTGGGLHLHASNVTLEGNTVRDNIASTAYDGKGGGIFLASGAVTLHGNIIVSNTATLSPTATGEGGGLCIYPSGSFTLTNNLLADNRANAASDGQGDGLLIEGKSWVPVSGRLLHNTIADNAGGGGQGVYVGSYITLALTNTIIAGHSVGITVTASSTVTLEGMLWYGNGTDVAGAGTILTGTVNVYGNPVFMNPEAWNYHLGAGSAAIDSGVDENITVDIDGEPRPQNTGYDIGADEAIHICRARLNDDPTDYGTVQAAVDASTQMTDVVKVAGYCTGVQARAGITQVVYISKTVTVRGGYTSTDWDTPDPNLNPTTLDAQRLGRVLVVVGDITPTVEGLRLTGGDATGLGGHLFMEDAGGGVHISKATVTISGCVIYSNTAGTTFFFDGYGGGLYLADSTATLTGNTVISNTASTAIWGYGGGLFLTDSDVMLQDNVIQGNTANTVGLGEGGGLYFESSDATLVNNMVISNTASTANDGWGGGLCLVDGSATLQNNTILGNAASWNPAAVGRGGGLYVQNGNPLTLTNNLVVGNRANTEGGGLWVASSSGYLLHTTIADNVANGDSGQGVYVGTNATLAFTNTIIAGHTGVGIAVTTGSTATLSATLWYANGVDTGGAGVIQTGTVNIHGDPVFINPSVWDYHLGPGSAAIDAGVDAGVLEDIDGDPRPQNNDYDIGVDEFDGTFVYLPLVWRNTP